MNFQTLNKQRKFILIASVIGLVSVFLPWISGGAMGYSRSSNGFNDITNAGVFVFLGFLVNAIISLLGHQHEPLDKTKWLVSMVAGVITLLGVVTFWSKASDIISSASASMNAVTSMFGQNEAKTSASFGYGLGFWLCALCAIGVLVVSWLFKNPAINLSNAVQDISLPNLPNINLPQNKTKAAFNKYEELERLLDLKTKGAITEEEYLAMKQTVMTEK
jgi:hypothetical protein